MACGLGVAKLVSLAIVLCLPLAATAQPQAQGQPLTALLEHAKARLLYVYDGIRHVEVPLADGRAVIGLSCERNSWTLFKVERAGRQMYSFSSDPAWGYLPAGLISSSGFCRDPVRTAE
ncbi:hypothetical protein KBY93_10060 [Synechococcus sp. J7-Johnson]|uniref:hypothetical protein n=1 Tax=Synechococcus sp. J7-Johnson TaxID=2823737 RepID=UPI0020CBA7C4|nr:hypothetical protein [Synechococcus sp. J7-Johnson]MCP9840978.1 hypothetical protein [Synechococcus sp. J7-Johnson]